MIDPAWREAIDSALQEAKHKGQHVQVSKPRPWKTYVYLSVSQGNAKLGTDLRVSCQNNTKEITQAPLQWVVLYC